MSSDNDIEKLIREGKLKSLNESFNGAMKMKPSTNNTATKSSPTEKKTSQNRKTGNQT